MSRNDWRARWPHYGFLIFSIVFFCPGLSWAQSFRLGTWEGSLEGVGTFTHDNTKSGDTPPSRSQDLLFEERLNLRNSGIYVIDPRILTLDLGGSVGFFQERFTPDGSTQTNTGNLWGYDTLARVLEDQPFSLNVFANRNQFLTTRELAGTSEGTVQNRGVQLFARSLYIPSTFTLRQDFLDEETRVSGIVSRQSEHRSIARYEGQRGWRDSDLELVYEYIDDKDEVFPSLNYTSQEAQVNYGVDFGADLNRHWDSRLRYYSRTGASATTQWTADETLVIDHTEDLRSDYRYRFIRIDTSGNVNSTHTAIASLRHRLYESLTSTATMDGVHQTFPQGSKDSIRGGLDEVYTKRLPWGGTLTIGAGGSLQYENDRFDTTVASVSQEEHAAGTPFALPISLNAPFVITSTVVVTKIALGPLPIGCVPPPGPPIPLVLGTDYTLQAVGDITQIVPIPCAGTTIGINPGDIIAVDYSFSVSPSLAFITSAWHANLDVDYGWIHFFYLHDQNDQTLVSGQDGRFLNNQRSDTVGAELRYHGSRLHAAILGEGRQFRSTQVDYDMLRGSAHADFAILPDLTLRLNADYIFTEFFNPSRETRDASARAGLTYVLGGNLFVDASAGYRRLQDTAQPTDALFEARLHVRWMFRKLEIIPSFEYFNRQRGDTSAIEYRAMLRTIRRF